MRRSLPLMLTLSALLAAGCAQYAAGPLAGTAAGGKLQAKRLPGKNGSWNERQLLVKMMPGAPPAVTGARVAGRLAGYELHELPRGTTLEAAIASYQGAAGVVSVERVAEIAVEEDPAPPAEVPRAPAPQAAANDARLFQQWSHPVGRVPAAWAVTRGRPDVVVAVLDTGVDAAHPDLVGQVIDGPDFAEGKDTSRDIAYHGTHVAGIIAARADNGIGVAGVAPGCRVLALKIFQPVFDDKGKYQRESYNEFSLARAIHYAATQGGAKVINISAGIPDSQLVATMLDFARGRGVIVCVSAGNNGSNAYTGGPKYQDGFLTVHATDSQDRLAPFSNYGTILGVAAPGMGILSTVPTYPHPQTGEVESKDGYAFLDGTSMASPFVAGVTALVVSALVDHVDALIKERLKADLKLTPADIPPSVVEDLLRKTAVDLGRPGRDEVYGAGRIDAGRAVEAAKSREWVLRTANEVLRNRRR